MFNLTKYLIKIIIFFYYLAIVQSKLAQVKDFKLIPITINFYDNFPIYFKCNFSIMNSNYSILFQRQDNKNLYFPQSDSNTKYFNYDSVYHADLNANAILFPDKTSFSNKTNRLKFEMIMTVFKSNELLFKLIRNFNLDRNKRSSKYIHKCI
jgi:hypothetical protein